VRVPVVKLILHNYYFIAIRVFRLQYVYRKRCTRIILLCICIHRHSESAIYFYRFLERERPIDFVYIRAVVRIYTYIRIPQPGDFIHSGRVPRRIYYIYTMKTKTRLQKRGKAISSLL